MECWILYRGYLSVHYSYRFDYRIQCRRFNNLIIQAKRISFPHFMEDVLLDVTPIMPEHDDYCDIFSVSH